MRVLANLIELFALWTACKAILGLARFIAWLGVGFTVGGFLLRTLWAVSEQAGHVTARDDKETGTLMLRAVAWLRANFK